MPRPTAEQIKFDKLLTDISLGYKNENYIADKIFPVIKTDQRAGIVIEYSPEDWFRDDVQLRAPGTKSVGGGFEIREGPHYFCEHYSIRKEIPDEYRAMAEEPINLDRDAVEWVTDKLMLKREVLFASKFFKQGVWGIDTSPTNEWSDYATSTPLNDLDRWRRQVKLQIGRKPNTLVLAEDVWEYVKWHPTLLELIKYTQKGVVPPDLFASIVELKQVLIGSAVVFDESTGELKDVFSNGALLIYVPERPGLMQPAAGYTFVWTIVPDALQYIKRMRDEEREVDIIEGNSYFDQKMLSRDAGLFAHTLIA